MVVKYIGEVVPGHLQSASAIEVFNNYIYVAGDSLSWIYVFNNRFHLVDRIPIGNHFSYQLISKPVKPDWEAMSVVVSDDQEPMLLIVGSGSLIDKRDNAVLLNLNTQEVFNVPHWPAFYTLLRSKLHKGDELNIEGLAQVGNKLLLFNRGSISTNNYIYVTEVLTGWKLPLTVGVIKSAPFDIKGVKAGFTGAYYIDDIDVLVYSAAAENTDNAYDDGEVVGSSVGYFKNISQRLKEAELSPDGQFVLNDIGITGKVESISLLYKKDNQHIFLAVTDNDGDPGSLYKLILEF